MDTFLEVVDTIQRIRRQRNFLLGLEKTRQLLNSQDKFNHVQYAYLYKQQAIFLHDLGDEENAVDAFWESACKSAIFSEQQEDYSNYLLLSHYLPHLTDYELAQRHFGYQQFFQEPLIYSHMTRKRKKIRIGYLSPDFRQHIVVDFAWPFFFQYDRKKFEVFCYDTKNRPDEITRKICHSVDGWTVLAGMDPKKAAEKIYQDKIDVLVDLAGHSDGGHTLRIAGYKPAPIQISGIGYMSTTGLRTMDYFLTDAYCDPLGHAEQFFSEQLLRLPQSHFCYHPPKRLLDISGVLGEHQGIVFGCFNNFSKITDDMLKIWLKILQLVPGSKILLKNSHADRHLQEERLYQRLESLGYMPEQIEIRSSSIDYLQEYREIDIALDTYPYTGGGTTCEALFMGVPVITLYGTRHGTRFGYSLLKNIDIAELAASNPMDYVKKAVALAQDRILLLNLKKQLRGMMQRSSLMNQKKYMCGIQTAYREIWQYWNNQ